MDERFDEFYLQHQRAVTFSECALGQLLDKEGALEPVQWREEWDEWSYNT
jgi:N-acetylglucosamine-6-sulfatase